MTRQDVVEILGWLDGGDVAVWLDGGWGVDALVGEQTRDHDDLTSSCERTTYLGCAGSFTSMDSVDQVASL